MNITVGVGQCYYFGAQLDGFFSGILGNIA